MRKIISFLIRYIPRKYLQQFSGVGLRVLGVFYSGHRVECPICGKQYRTFLPYGRINPRANALCPNCQSLERHRLIWLYLQEKTNFFSEPLSVLHVAPESCFMHPFEVQHGSQYVTADLESPLAKVKMDIHEMPFNENYFDVVLCNHVLEHVKDDLQAMREIKRVLKPGGWCILQVPFFSPVPEHTLEDASITQAHDRERAFGQDDHARKYGKDYLKRIETSGMSAMADPFAKGLTDEEATRYGISRGEIIYRGTKQSG
jgi:SAM-dependent methyltransferase